LNHDAGRRRPPSLMGALCACGSSLPHPRGVLTMFTCQRANKTPAAWSPGPWFRVGKMARVPQAVTGSKAFQRVRRRVRPGVLTPSGTRSIAGFGVLSRGAFHALVAVWSPLLRTLKRPSLEQHLAGVVAEMTKYRAARGKKQMRVFGFQFAVI
jgi:hypothetical protein